MHKAFLSTEGGKAGTIDGLGLFFGALLGANLGTIQGMGRADYVQLIVLLAGTVIVIRMVSTSERKVYMTLTLLFYVAILSAMLLVPALQPKGIAAGDLHRLAATLAIWMIFVVLAEFMPVQKADAESAER